MGHAPVRLLSSRWVRRRLRLSVPNGAAAWLTSGAGAFYFQGDQYPWTT
jgi:hypothetical protein